MNSNKTDRNYSIFLFVVFALVWAWSGWKPATPENWFLEHSIVLFLLPLVLLFMWRIRLSKLSLSLIVLFTILHTIGAHYNYGSVPFGVTVGNLLGTGGNMYDKFVHYCFGLLIVYPVSEALTRMLELKSFWNYFFSFHLILAWSAVYEMIEWVTVLKIDNPQLAYLYIGGNDPFDTAKDMVLAGLGALITLSLVAYLNYRKSGHANGPQV